MSKEGWASHLDVAASIISVGLYVVLIIGMIAGLVDSFGALSSTSKLSTVVQYRNTCEALAIGFGALFGGSVAFAVRRANPSA